MFQPLEQFDPIILFSLYDYIYVSTIMIQMYLIFFFSAYLFSKGFIYRQTNIKLLNKKFINVKKDVGYNSNWNFFKYISQNIINFFTFELFQQQVTKKAQVFYLIFFNLFIFLLFSNLSGLIFYGFTITSHISVTFFFSITFFLAIIIIGIVKHGKSFINILIPSGAPSALLPFLILIEFISYFSRVFSLAIRLFANMMSGHTLLVIIASFSVYCWINFFLILFFISFFAIFLILFLEFSIAALQAYVFVVLGCIYLNDAYNLTH